MENNLGRSLDDLLQDQYDSDLIVPEIFITFYINV